MNQNHLVIGLDSIDDLLPLEICVKILKENSQESQIHLGFLSINLDQLFAQ